MTQGKKSADSSADLAQDGMQKNRQGAVYRVKKDEQKKWCTRREVGGCEITVSMKKEDFSFKMNERSSFCVKINLR